MFNTCCHYILRFWYGFCLYFLCRLSSPHCSSWSEATLHTPHNKNKQLVKEDLWIFYWHEWLLYISSYPLSAITRSWLAHQKIPTFVPNNIYSLSSLLLLRRPGDARLDDRRDSRRSPQGYLSNRSLSAWRSGVRCDDHCGRRPYLGGIALNVLVWDWEKTN